ncbi:MAG TPA: DinB family protein [Actinomycetota bacterium]|nr:DinB family protein [Actinomycetota bacterium]
MSPKTEIYLEVGTRRVFAGALTWPGWCRSGRTEDAAIETLHDYARRYAAVLSAAGITFTPPRGAGHLQVVERLKGDATTDFGAPSIAPAADDEPIKPADARRLGKILEACWAALDSAAKAAASKKLRKGPRGGGRELSAIVTHVLDAESAYLRSMGGSFKRDERADLSSEASRLREAILETLSARARGEPPPDNPRRKAKPWTPRYFVRRTAWHALDHAWEIEDRAEP